MSEQASGSNPLSLAVAALAIAALSCGGDDAPAGAAAIDDNPTSRLAAQSAQPIDVKFSAHGYARAVRAKVPVDGDPSTAATAFVEEHAALFGLDQPGYAVEAVNTIMLGGNSAIVAMQADYQGVPIEGGLLGVAIRAGEIRFVESGVPFPQPQLDTTPTIAQEAAAATVRTLWSDTVTAELPVLVFADIGAMLGDEGTGPRLAWRVDVLEPVAETVIVSATSGNVLLREAQEQPGLARTARWANKSSNYVEATRTGELLGSDPGGVVETGTERLENAELNALVAYAFVGTAFDYFWDRFGWESYDGACAPVTILVDVDDTNGDNAFWSNRAKAIAYTDAFITEDITVHEYGHAVNAHVGIGQPRYQLESGALNESLADSFAAFAAEDEGRWTIGEGLLDGAIRDMQDPTSVGGGRDHTDTFFAKAEGPCDEIGECNGSHHACRAGTCVCLDSSADCDYGGVHFNSGILNHAVYLMAEGGQHATHGGLQIQGIGLEKTEQIVFLAARLLMPNIRFSGWREDLIWACQTLAEEQTNVGGAGVISHADCGTVINALAAVGIGPRDSDRDSWHDDVDICPDTPNPEQDRDAVCANDPYRHCRAYRYRTAFDQFKEGVDIGTSRSDGDALLVTANCMMLNRDFQAAESTAVAGAAAGSKGGRAANLYLAEFCAEKTGRLDDAQRHREASLEAGKASGECAGAEGDLLEGCAELQRTVALESLQRSLEETPN